MTPNAIVYISYVCIYYIQYMYVCMGECSLA